MNEYDVKRLALVLAIQSEIEGMKLRNLQVGPEHCDALGYSHNSFFEKAEELKNLAAIHNDQL